MKNEFFALILVLTCTSQLFAQITIRQNSESTDSSSVFEAKPREVPNFKPIWSIGLLPSDAIIGGYPITFQYSFNRLFSMEGSVGLTYWEFNPLRNYHSPDPGWGESIESSHLGTSYHLRAKLYPRRFLGIMAKHGYFFSFGFAHRNWTYEGGSQRWADESSRTLSEYRVNFLSGYRYQSPGGFYMEWYAGYSPAWAELRIQAEDYVIESYGFNSNLLSMGFQLGYWFEKT
ncbi:MAG: hypothetical protein HWD92_12850 [Flavobacteriia bacterium]|nr:hypothetical protein [Flavobacteriia bacterium]